MAWVGFPAEKFTWTGEGGEPKWYNTFPTTKRGFCPECGSTVAAIDDGSNDVGITMMALCAWVVIDQRGLRPARRCPPDGLVPLEGQLALHQLPAADAILTVEMPTASAALTRGGAVDAELSLRRKVLVFNVNREEIEMREGGCLCGNIRYQTTGDPDFPHVCWCDHCQKLSGSPVKSWVNFPVDGFTWTGPGGEPKWYRTWPTTKRGFCPECGSSFVAIDDDGRMMGVTIVSLDDPAGLIPTHQSFKENAVPWLALIG